MELLFKQNYNRIYEYCYLKLGPPPQDAEDCAMEVFCRAFRHMETLMEHACPERWLYVAARNGSLEQMRNRNRGGVLDDGTLLAGTAGGEQSVEDSLFSEKDGKEEGEKQLEEMLLGSLKPGEQELYRLLVTEGKSVSQVAAELSISYTNATTRVYRLRKKLKRQLERKEGKGHESGQIS